MFTRKEIDRVFSYGLLSDLQRADCKLIFALAHHFAVEIYDVVPDSPEKEMALKSLQACLLWCDAAIAIRGVD